MKDWLSSLTRFLPGHETSPPEPEGVRGSTSMDKPERLEVADTVEVTVVRSQPDKPRRIPMFSFPDGSFLGYRIEEPPELDDADFDVLSDGRMAAFLAETDV